MHSESTCASFVGVVLLGAKVMFRLYSNPKATGWLGWFENANGKATAFVGLDRKVVFMHELG